MWKRDTQGAVVSTPAVVGDRVVVGNRSYDLLGLDARTGEPRVDALHLVLLGRVVGRRA